MKSKFVILPLFFALGACGQSSQFADQSLSYKCSGQQLEFDKMLNSKTGPFPISDREFLVDTTNEKAEFFWLSHPDKRYPVCGFDIDAKFELDGNMLKVAGSANADRGGRDYCAYDIDLSNGRSTLMRMHEDGNQQTQIIWDMRCEKK